MLKSDVSEHSLAPGQHSVRERCHFETHAVLLVAHERHIREAFLPCTRH